MKIAGEEEKSGKWFHRFFGCLFPHLASSSHHGNEDNQQQIGVPSTQPHPISTESADAKLGVVNEDVRQVDPVDLALPVEDFLEDDACPLALTSPDPEPARRAIQPETLLTNCSYAMSPVSDECQVAFGDVSQVEDLDMSSIALGSPEQLIYATPQKSRVQDCKCGEVSAMMESIEEEDSVDNFTPLRVKTHRICPACAAAGYPDCRAAFVPHQEIYRTAMKLTNTAATSMGHV